MFTGIVEELGRVRSLSRGSRSCVIELDARVVTSDLKVGDSVAVNGLCLTATAVTPRGFTADVMPESLARSSLAAARPGTPVNLERAMAANGRFGGHIVSGHVDGTGTVADVRRDVNAVWFTVKADPEVMRLVVEKGSIAIDGISLTVARVDAGGFAVSVIPHTLEVTTLGQRRPGDAVNLETDVVGKYVAHLLGRDPAPAGPQAAGGPGAGGPATPASSLANRPGTTTPVGAPGRRAAPDCGVTLDFLARSGFC